MKKVLNNSEFFLGIIMFVVVGILTWQITIIKIPESRIFPIVSLVIMALSSVAIIVNSLKKTGSNLRSILLKKKQILLILALVISYPLFEILGFYTTLFLLLLTVLSIQNPNKNKKNIIFIITYSAVVIIICFICFYLLLGLITPSGVLI